VAIRPTGSPQASLHLARDPGSEWILSIFDKVLLLSLHRVSNRSFVEKKKMEDIGKWTTQGSNSIGFVFASGGTGVALHLRIRFTSSQHKM
jgi:hypothetical protein